jgi:pyruvate formate lyase activating enzyme
MAVDNNADSWSFTYSEPTVFVEYAIDLAEEARLNGVSSIWVTNGSMSPDVLKALPPAVVAMNIDLKAFSDKFYREVTCGRLGAVKDNIELALSLGIWVEVTTLVISGLNDSDEELSELTAFLASLSVDLPWHISRFFPRHRQSHIPATPLQSLEKARYIGHKNGLKHVYIGNAFGPGYGDTVCPNCGRVLIARDGYLIVKDELTPRGVCSNCQARIAGRWRRGLVDRQAV